MREIVDPSIPKDSILILDILGNSSVRFSQADDQDGCVGRAVLTLHTAPISGRMGTVENS